MLNSNFKVKNLKSFLTLLLRKRIIDIIKMYAYGINNLITIFLCLNLSDLHAIYIYKILSDQRTG